MSAPRAYFLGGPYDDAAVEVVHGLADVAAHLALLEWERSEHGDAASRLSGALWHAVRDLDAQRRDWNVVEDLHAASFAATQDGARLGFALGLAASSAVLGWDGWIAAARAILAHSYCNPAEHLASEVEHLRVSARELGLATGHAPRP